MFHIADPQEIREGKLTDLYFVRTMEVLKAKRIDKWVKAELITKRFPEVSRAPHPVYPRQKDPLGPSRTTGHTRLCP